MNSPFRLPLPYTIREAIDAAMIHIASTRAPGTIVTYRGHGRQFAAEWGSMPLHNLRGPHIDAWRLRQLEAGAAPATINHKLGFLSIVFQLAHRSGRSTAENPVRGIDWLPVCNQREIVLTRGQEDDLLKFLRWTWPKEPWNGDMVRLLLMTGMRRQELWNLERSHILPYPEPTGELEIVRSKTGKKRWIPLSEEGAATVQRLLARHGERFVVHTLNGSATRQGQAHVWYQGRYKPAVRAIGLPDVRVHDLRHSAATRWLTEAMHEDGRPATEREIQELLGHSSPQQTQRYAHLTREHLHKLMRKFR